MSAYDQLKHRLLAQPHRWLVTGAAGFIGSHLLETLLSLDQRVVALDNFSSGGQRNLDEVRARVGEERWSRCEGHAGSVTDPAICRQLAQGVEFILHQAGFVSVPRSMEDPAACHATNVTGTLNILSAAHEAGVRRMVYASSSAVYGDDARLPKIESQIGRPLSPYGASKHMTEIYAQVFANSFRLPSVGLRYFNIFGSRQDPAGGYAAVIPQWIAKLLHGEECVIHGEGGITRDFCPVGDVVQANLLAATTDLPAGVAHVFNVALGGSTTLAQLHALLASAVEGASDARARPLRFGPPREGDILHSSADISAIRAALDFSPSPSLDRALRETVQWYANRGALV